MKRKQIWMLALGAALILGACAPKTAPAPESAADESGAAAQLAAGSPEPSLPQQAASLAAPELETEGKIIPGCRSTLPYPLKMTGESDASDFSRWSATDLQGNTVNQDILQESKLTLVHIWATFCGGHVEELQALQQLYAGYERAELNVMGIVVNVQDREGKLNQNEVDYVQYLLDLTEAEYPQLLPSDDLIQIKLKDLGTLPESFLLDSAGRIVGEPWFGARTVDELQKIVDAALKE